MPTFCYVYPDMDTVNFNCELCGKLMAVSTAHLGAQVSCPHCQGIVQAPLPPTDSVAEPVRDSASPVSDSHESIFASGESASEDIFGTAPAAHVELPQATGVVQERSQAGLESPTYGPAPGQETEAHQAVQQVGQVPSWLQPLESPAVSERPAVVELREDDDFVHRRESLPAKPRRARSMLGPILLIFLIPYALVSTGVIVWLLYTRNQSDPFEFLRDPNPDPKDGAPERLKHDAQLPPKLRTVLTKPVRVGDVEVTPLKVEHRNGDLVLSLRMRNLSSDLVFTPLPRSFVEVAQERRPYTFLDVGPHRLYGGRVEYGKANAQGRSDGRLRPGQEMQVSLCTARAHRPRVPKSMPPEQPLLWRVQLRRGLVDVDGTPRSATTVIGIEFTARAIEKTYHSP